MISIVLPVYNAERFLADTLQTVRAQTYADWEVIVVDDGCTDGTPILVQEWARQDRRIRMVAQANAGCAAARNTGLQHISPASEYVIFLDHDDLWEPDALANLLAAVQSHPDAVGAIGQVQKFRDEDAETLLGELRRKADLLRARTDDRRVNAEGLPAGAIEWANTPSAPTPVLETLPFAEMAVCCQAVTMGQALIRRAILDTVGPLDLNCVPSDDWELYLRLALHGPFVVTTAPVIWWRSHASNTSNDRARMYQAEKRVRATLLARPDLSTEQRRMILTGKRQLAARQWGYARMYAQRHEWAEAFRQLRYALRSYARSWQALS